MITDYDSLKAAVALWANRSDLTDLIPDFIREGERRIWRNLRCPGNEKLALYVASSELDNTEGFAIPPDFLECRYLLYGDNEPLNRVTDMNMLTLMARSTAAGVPRKFARIGQSMAFWPTGDSNEDVRMLYYAEQGPLSDEVPSTKMLELAPLMYLHFALAEAANYLKAWDESKTWLEKAESALAELNEQGIDNETDGSTVSVVDPGC